MIARKLCGGMAALALLAGTAVSSALAVDDVSPGHVCEIKPDRVAIQPADDVRDTAARGTFDPRWPTNHRAGEKVYVGNAIVTDDAGSLSVWRTGDRQAIVTGLSVQGMRVVVPVRSAVEIKDAPDEAGVASFVNLLQGGVEIQCLGCGAGTRNARAENPKSHFILRYSDDRVPITEVVTVSGAVTVRNPAGGRTVTVARSQRTLVIGNDPPSDPDNLDATQIAGYRRPFVLVGGGRDQSQLVDNTEIRDLELPDGDGTVRPPAPVTSGPPSVDQPLDDANKPSDLIEPDTPALDGPGLGIQF